MHGRCACAHNKGHVLAQAGEPGKAIRDRPPWALCHDREFPVATEKANPVS